MLMWTVHSKVLYETFLVDSMKNNSNSNSRSSNNSSHNEKNNTFYELHQDVIRGVKVLSDGRSLSWSADGTVIVCDLMKGHAISLEGMNNVLSHFQLVDHDKHCVSWDDQYGRLVWVDLEKKDTRSVKAQSLMGHTTRVFGARSLLAGKFLCSWSFFQIILWDIKTRSILWKLNFTGEDTALEYVELVPNNDRPQHIFTRSRNGGIAVFAVRL